MNPKVGRYLRELETWRVETEKLRKIILDYPLVEELKWGKPCYTFQGCNLLVIQGFKQYFALMFFQGALLKDPKHILQRPGENTQVARQMRFCNAREIARLEPTVRAYIKEAIEAEKSGRKVEFKAAPEPIPEELRRKWTEFPALKTAFEGLTPGRQRAYLLFFSAAKLSETRASRIGKCMPQILLGKGLND
ncbi:MAG: YdeI/OmpD-associated family protein [Opitutaceae bacterium]